MKKSNETNRFSTYQKQQNWIGQCLVVLLLSLVGCGMDGSQNKAGTTVDIYGNPVVKTTTPTASGTSKIALALTSTSIQPGNSATLTVTVSDSYSAAVANAIVTLVADSNGGSIASVTPTTVLTDSSGKATATLTGVKSGVASLSATTQLNGTALTSSINYTVGSLALSLTPLQFGVSPLSANGSTSITTDVYSNNAPLNNTPTVVSFSSTCAAIGKASIDSSVTSDGYGHAVATYVDQGCAGTDVVTAMVGTVTNNGSLTVLAPTAGSIQFVSATPASITLKGMGGQGHQESSVVQFKVVDNNNTPISGKTVNFALTTSLGGITLGQSSGVTDSAGSVSVSVLSGSISTPVRVIASTTGSNGATLQTQSDALTITTGVPDQDSASLSVTQFNIEGAVLDGTSTVLTMRLADHFNNPVPDGTAINFTAEGGVITPSCTTVNGSCSATLTSSNPRPNDARVTVLAYALGEESFTDLNGNGLADSTSEMVDINGVSTDLYEAFRDDNFNGVRDGYETFFDINGDGRFSPPDGLFSGVLCDTTSTICSPYKNVHVRASTEIIFASSSAVITPYSSTNPITFSATECKPNQGKVHSVIYRVLGKNGSVMPAGTTVSITTTNGTITSPTSYTIPSTNQHFQGASPPTVGDDIFDFYTTIITDSTYNTTTFACDDTTPSGTITVKVTSPSGKVSTDNSIQVVN